MDEPKDRGHVEDRQLTLKEALLPVLFIPAAVLVLPPLIFLTTLVIPQSWLIDLCGGACTPHGLEFIRKFYSD